MRNLKTIESSLIELDFEFHLAAISWDASTDSIICASGPTPASPAVSLQRLINTSSKTNKSGLSQAQVQEKREVASWDALCPLPELDCDQILCLQPFADESSICLVFAGGDIVLVREDPSEGQEKIEIVGSVDAGITAAQWSPDEELLAITTRADTLLFMTKDFNHVTDVPMTETDLDASKQVSVGWGKSETQFKGKRAKALRDPTMPEHVDEGKLSKLDQGHVTISWRGDGAFVAISSVHQCSRRAIRVYSRDYVLDSVSEAVDGLESGLSWRPAGNLIASIQRFEDRVDVVFFERNGLRHGQFTLRLSQEDMSTLAADIKLAWNIDSSVLAVIFKDRIQFWTMGNYHWYLKQETSFPQAQASAAVMVTRWHPEKALRFAYGTQHTIMTVEYISTTLGGSLSPPHDFGFSGVIDGDILKLTPMRLANIPPPMAHYEASTGSPIIDVSFSQDCSNIATLHRGHIQVHAWNQKGDTFSERQSNHPIIFPGSSQNLVSQQICFLGNSMIFVLSTGLEVTAVTCFMLEGKDISSLENWHAPNSKIVRLFARSDHQRICIEDVEGTIAEAEPSSKHLHFQNLITLPTRTPWIELVKHKEKPIAFGLSSKGLLYANDRLLARNCTSFMVTPSHLVFTTTNHLLKFVHMCDVENIEVPSDDPEKDERCRSIERGARLVTVMPSAFSLTLQMPRGNLETIYPRALVLAGVRHNIASKNYRKAFLACRNHRVDMNILHDYAPVQFLQNVALFVQQVKKVEHIDLFLSSLRDEDVSKTMYRDTIPQEPSGPEALIQDVEAERGPGQAYLTTSSKVNRICDAFLTFLNGQMSTNLQNVITAHVCKQPADLLAGLTVVDQMRDEYPELAEKAVEHICFLADLNKLFDCALGIYNLDLALLIAQQSQKDPREYLPFLQNLQEMSQIRRQYSIDHYLGNFSKALRHLHDLDEFEELKIYTIKHGLYEQALQLYKYSQERSNLLMHLYADFLESHAKFNDAGNAYEYLGEYRKATQSYRSAGSWRECLYCASLASLTAPEITEIATALADTLYESKEYADAAALYLDYRNDVETAIRYLCKGYHFADAMRLASLRGRQDLLETAVDAGLVEGLANSTELLAECRAQLNAQVPRLREVRAKKDEDPLAFFGGDSAVNADNNIPDNVSLAPTDASTAAGGSLFTRYTNRTATSRASSSRNRRREERKRARGKKGSVYEEEYLVNSIRRLYERILSVRDDVRRLIAALFRRGMRERAIAVERTMVEVVGMCEASREEVFYDRLKGGLTGGGEAPTTRATESGPDDREREELPSTMETLPPAIMAFERLSVLGGEA
ncbi:MAG: DNA repair protein rad52 [Chaenotheca gracillima]|nr:MAG: DNA repair protein rad52 [Chaenotheca gracillima]